jgi:hypothetical protein
VIAGIAASATIDRELSSAPDDALIEQAPIDARLVA